MSSSISTPFLRSLLYKSTAMHKVSRLHKYIRARAVADPIPPVAPVMRAKRPLRFFPDILTTIFVTVGNEICLASDFGGDEE